MDQQNSFTGEVKIVNFEVLKLFVGRLKLFNFSTILKFLELVIYH